MLEPNEELVLNIKTDATTDHQDYQVLLHNDLSSKPEARSICLKYRVLMPGQAITAKSSQCSKSRCLHSICV